MRFLSPRAGLLAAALATLGCAAGLEQTMPGERIDPQRVIERIERAADRLETDKQVFRVRLLEEGRTFSGDGALAFRAPDTLQLSIYGPPFTTLWMQMLIRGDSVTVVLPKDDKVIRASRSDPVKVTELAASEGLTDAEFMGAVTGVFRIDHFRTPSTRMMASSDGAVDRLRLIDGDTAYQFLFDRELDAVLQFTHYTDGNKRREVTRGDFHAVDSLQRARRTVYRDYYEDREITVLVNRETVNPELTEQTFQLLLPDES